MPFTDPVSSISGRNSRASNVSGMTGASRSIRSGPAPAGQPSDTLANAGVLSMLKTSTDTGDIGSLSFNSHRLPTMPRPAHPRRGHISKPSGSPNHRQTGTGSHHSYAPSQTSRISDSTTFQRGGSLISMQSMPPSLPPVNVGKAQLQIPPPTLDRSRDSRSYSLTSAPACRPLPRHRSSTSLKSAGHQPRHGPRLRSGHPPPLMENRPAYVYPTRLKRPGYRSPSPALSELSIQAPAMPHSARHAAPPQAVRHPPPSGSTAMPRPLPQTYNSDYGTEFQQGHPSMNVRLPPRAMNSSPDVGYRQNHFVYQPGPTGPYPNLQMPSRPHPPHQHQLHAPHRGPYPGPQYHQRPTYPPDYQVQYAGLAHPMNPNPHFPSSAAPMAATMFHNAARMARQLPQRTDTPMTDLSPPSSDPPSSGTAPTSSSPPTPKDQTIIQVTVDPLFIDPALTDLPDSSSEPALPAKYFEFSEGNEILAKEPNMEVPHPSVPPTGFVQRVKAMLESKATIDAATKQGLDCERMIEVEEATLDPNINEGLPEIHELAANETPRFTIIEEFEAPVELPASPVELAELVGSPITLKEQRITREMVKAELAPSVTNIESTSHTEENTEEHPKMDVQVRTDINPGNDAASSRRAPCSKPAFDHILSTPIAKERQVSTSNSDNASSPEATGISGIDYALRFSVPVDTTITPEETQSRDPFVLDADTVTLQQQRSKDKAHRSESHKASSEQQTTSAALASSEECTSPPVSPLLSGEDVSRHSAVSPLHNQTFGIDETLQLVPDERVEDTGDLRDQSLPVSSREDNQPPPTPRTPKTYSKSLSLPQSSTTFTETPTINRFSLPPDLNTLGETTLNTTSDMITDVAVRFSLPTTTITISKPQIVTIPPSSSPERQESPPPPLSKMKSLDPKSAQRNSVTFADQIAPLNIKKTDPRRESQPRTETAVPSSKSIMRRQSQFDDISASSRTSCESTTDLRFPVDVGVNSRFCSAHLPGLKEESVEDMSINEAKRGNDVVNEQPFPLPARIAAVKAMQERRLHESAERAKARRAARHHNRPLAEIRDLPSLNFSRMDLIDKLNEALETRPSKSIEDIRPHGVTGIVCPSPQRPQSTEQLRERYTSFFSKPEDFSVFDEVEDEGEEWPEPMPNGELVVEVQESKPSGVEIGDEVAERPLSPEDFLNVATQVNRLSIPSITALSERLSELLPCLRNLHLNGVLSSDEDVAHTIENIHNLGQGPRPDTVLSGRTSAGIRTLAERAEDFIQNAAHDSIVPVAKLLMTNKDLPSLPESSSADHVSAVNSADGKQSYLSGSVSAPSDLGKDAVCWPAALTRQKSPTTEEEVRQMLPPEMNPITRGAKCSTIHSQASSRPWNQDENYPWAGKGVDIDLSVPSEAQTSHSVTGEVLHCSDSLDMTSSGGPNETPKGIDIGSIITSLERSTSITTEQATGVTGQHLRKQSKRSIISSLSKKMGFGSKSQVEDTTCTLPSPAICSSDAQPHKPGDRYPTTALTPPAAFNMDEVRSFFSDNSSENKRTISFRKRLPGFKGKGKSVRLQDTCDKSLDGTTTYDAGSMNVERIDLSRSAQTYDGVGMGKTEFRIKRLGEKLRHLLAKGGELLRSWSTRSKAIGPERIREDWLSDSLYSGV